MGFNLVRLFPETTAPFTSPGNTAPSVKDWPALNLEDPEWAKALFDQYHPNILLYCHAVCDVPKCEADPEWAYEVNVGHLQRTLKALPHQSRLVYISSDHVFGGDGTYDEQSPPCPISVYGRNPCGSGASGLGETAIFGPFGLGWPSVRPRMVVPDIWTGSGTARNASFLPPLSKTNTVLLYGWRI